MVIFWLLLFIIIVIVSFLLSYQSMRNFQEAPRQTGKDYSLFLIRNLSALNTKLLEELHSEFLKKAAFISLERLTKGNKVALVIYGPKKILQQFQSELNLLELEDYTRKYLQENLFPKERRSPSLVFEMAKKKQLIGGEVFTGLPNLKETEQFWWQLIFQPKNVQKKKIFVGQIRVGLILNQDQTELIDQFESLAGGKLLKAPRPYSREQMRLMLLNRTLNFAHAQKFEIPEVLSLLG
ncbi:MAG: hypothetical protein HYW45_03470 [Candidatus Daviesbacteria bacterium]|nr:MAG: hypothetical protein HYW45_03470 [Candidatus Daviesbacteria bacterium]